MVSAKLLVFFSCAIAVALAVPSGNVLGGGEKLSGNQLKEATEILKNSLSELAAGDGPSYTVSKVNSATKQTVSGTIYKFDVDLIDGNSNVKQCNVDVWSRPWLQPKNKVTVNCHK